MSTPLMVTRSGAARIWRRSKAISGQGRRIFSIGLPLASSSTSLSR